jgi:hypothetical protein
VKPLPRGTSFRLHLPVRALAPDAPSATRSGDVELADAGPELALG